MCLSLIVFQTYPLPLHGTGEFISHLIVVLYWIFLLRVVHPSFMSLSAMLANAVAVIVAFVPEGLPLALSMGLNIIARRLCRTHSVLVKRFGIIESLGSMSLLASDKTGTLTENKMSVTGALSVSGASYNTRDLFSMVAAYNSRKSAAMQLDVTRGVQENLFSENGQLKESRKCNGEQSLMGNEDKTEDLVKVDCTYAQDKITKNEESKINAEIEGQERTLEWLEAVFVISVICNQAAIQRKSNTMNAEGVSDDQEGVREMPDDDSMGPVYMKNKVTENSSIEVVGSNRTDRILLKWAHDILCAPILSESSAAIKSLNDTTSSCRLDNHVDGSSSTGALMSGT